MTPGIPTFAVVGHPNKGKSSIVATLAEDERVVISETPGTTRHANRHTFSIDGLPQYVLVDTPGFQRPGELLAWLQAHAGSAGDRPGVVSAFIVNPSHGRGRYSIRC
jgi:predicted GTPase